MPPSIDAAQLGALLRVQSLAGDAAVGEAYVFRNGAGTRLKVVLVMR